MRNSYILLVLLISTALIADTHSYQVLNPYGSDEHFLKSLEAYESHVSVTVEHFEGDFDDPEELYIYFYVLNVENLEKFELDVSCPNETNALPMTRSNFRSNFEKIKVLQEKPEIANIESIYSDPIYATDRAVITADNEISWKLQSEHKKQALWLYSKMPPIERYYSLTTKQDMSKDNSQGWSSDFIGKIKGPSCHK